MIAATTQAMILVPRLLTNNPILCWSLVNKMSGMTAKLSCMERITWLNNKRFAIPLSPYKTVTINAGIIAMPLVINLLSQGFKRTPQVMNHQTFLFAIPF